MSAADWFQIAQAVVMTAVLGLLWSVRHAFTGGQWTTTVENRLTGLERIVAEVQGLIERARDKSSETEGRTTAKMGAIEIALNGLQKELTMRAEQAKTDHHRFERDIAAIRRDLGKGE